MKVPFVELGKENAIYKDEILKSVETIIDSGKYILGENVSNFEAAISNIYANNYCVGLNSGADALFLGLKSLNLPEEAEVVVPANSFIASAWSVVNANLTLKFCDVGKNMNVTSSNLLAESTDKTKVWMPVHLTGAPCKLSEIVKEKKEQIMITEDAAQAFGAGDQSCPIGMHGVFSAFSLNPLKVLGVIGDGGFLITQSDSIASNVKRLRNHGLQNRDDANCWGYNSRLDEIQASIALIKIKNFNQTKACIKRLAGEYITQLSKDVIIPNKDSLETSSWHRFVIITEKRDELKKYLSKVGVETAINYEVPLHLLPVGRKLGYVTGDFPVVEMQARCKLSLPLYPHMSDDKIYHVIDSINKFFN
jgi:dTDP-4-amino-4,6-dideoxygalactose transaminase